MEDSESRIGGVSALVVVVVLIVVGATLVPVVVLGHSGSSASTPADSTRSKTAEDVKFVRPAPNSTATIWPFTSRAKRFESLTLPINLVFRTDAEMTRYVLTHRGDEEWENQTALHANDTNVSVGSVVVDGTDVDWRQAHGGDRYTYIRGPGGGRWVTSVYQLHDGDYFGTRHHLRLYEGGRSQHTWTAIQAHTEHWDWFGLRHSVGSLAKAQHYVEREFYGKWYVSTIQKVRFANGGALDANGWVTVLNFEERAVLPPILYLLPVLVGLSVDSSARDLWAATRDELRRRFEDTSHVRHNLALFGVVAVIPLVVRVGAITVERAFPAASAVLVGGPFYLLLVVGLPMSAALLARRHGLREGFVLAFVGFGVGVLIDYAYLNIAVLQFRVLLHRIAAATALGLVAAGGARGEWVDGRDVNVPLVVGGLAWVAVVLGPIVGIR